MGARTHRRRTLVLTVGVVICTVLVSVLLGFVAGNRRTDDGGWPTSPPITIHNQGVDRPRVDAVYWQKWGFMVKTKVFQRKPLQAEFAGILTDWVEVQERFELLPLTHEAVLEEAIDALAQRMELAGHAVEVNWKEASAVLAITQPVLDTGYTVPTHVYRFDQITPLCVGSVARAEGGEGLLDPGEEIETTLRAPPKLAVVIDDWGYPSIAVDMLLRYPFPLTQAILPYLPISYEVAARAAEMGHEVILHQPMEPLNSELDMGEGGISISMDFAEIREQLVANVQHLPMVTGVNNHMGSKVTTDRTTMAAVFSVLQELDLFFLDSMTAPATVTRSVARDIPVPYAVNQLFIDNINEVELIKIQIRRGLQQAKRSGRAIVIGHVRPRTARALWEMIPEIVESGVRLVPVSHLLTYPQVQPAYREYSEVEL